MMLSCALPRSEVATSFFQAGLIVMGVVYPCQVFTYNRNMLKEVLWTFEFWFVAAHMMGVCCGFGLGDVLNEAWFTLALRIEQDTMLCVAIFGMDASSMRRNTKAALMSIVCLVWLGWTFLLQTMSRNGMDTSLAVPFVNSTYTVRQMLTTCAFTISVFCGKYAFVSFVQKSDALMIRLNPRRVDLNPDVWWGSGEREAPSVAAGNNKTALLEEQQTEVVDRMSPYGQPPASSEGFRGTAVELRRCSETPSSYRFV
jgi:hypothetical protein